MAEPPLSASGYSTGTFAGSIVATIIICLVIGVALYYGFLRSECTVGTVANTLVVQSSTPAIVPSGNKESTITTMAMKNKMEKFGFQ